MADVLIEFKCEHHTNRDEEWIKEKVQPADMRLRVLSDNLVLFDFMNGDEVLHSYRLCWGGFMNLIIDLEQWFLSLNTEFVASEPSCVDGDQILQFMVHEDFVVSMSFGKKRPEIVFYTNRSDILHMLDSAARVVIQQPPAGCYRVEQKIVQIPIALDRQQAERMFAKLKKKGHTEH